MKHIYSILMFCVISVSTTLAQGFTPTISTLKDMEDLSFKYRQESNESLLGSYLDNNWTIAMIMFNNKPDTINLECKYNIPQDNFVFKSGDKQIALTNPFLLDYIQYKHKRFVYCKLPKALGFYEEIVSGKAKLWRKYYTIFEDIVDATPYTQAKPAKYIIKSRYYLVFGEQEPVLIAKSRKSVAAQFTDKSTQVLNYIKSEKLKPSEEADMVKIIAYYNSL